jgi:cellulose synthase/poly-beta-1,6-N-acetylglucosamine synthase-like glycosyltransferase
MRDFNEVGAASGRAVAIDHPRIGGLLVERGFITPEQLEQVLAIQTRTGALLGSILLALGMVRRIDVFRALADLWQMPFVDLTTTAIDEELVRRVPPQLMASERWIPVRVDQGAAVIATANRPTPQLQATVIATLGDVPVTYAVTTEWDINNALQRVFGDTILEDATLGLRDVAPHQSASYTLTAIQRVVLVLALAMLAAALTLNAAATAIVVLAVINLGFLAGVVFKFVTAMAGARHERMAAVTDDEVAALDETTLPRYTVLVPLYDEADVVGQLLDNLAALDYPADRIEVLLLLEEHDDKTIAAARAARPPGNFHFVLVPEGHPQTKPKACNVGLFFATGEYLVIYDAEDRPEPDQLKKVVAAFRAAPRDVICFQAALNYFNARQNFLTRMFTLEYSYWFDYMLTGLHVLRLPIPLGGTSNHFRTGDLRALGAWDPFNVTEDADLGIRATARRYRVGVINSTTYEEANSQYGNWIRQRSRWIKGYMQTSIVHLRQPWRLLRSTGVRNTLSFALLIAGTPLSFLTAPPLWALCAVWIVLGADGMAWLFPGVMLYLSLFNLLVGTTVMIYLTMMGGFKRRNYDLVLWALATPLYLVLHSIASYKALWQLVTRPHYWEKTTHGLAGE